MVKPPGDEVVETRERRIIFLFQKQGKLSRVQHLLFLRYMQRLERPLDTGHLLHYS
jgi:hypothetical protein